jgi:L-ectoine synthase
MILRKLGEILGTWRHASGDGWESRRIVLADDEMGYSMHDTLVKEGAELHLEYKNHLEANYCIEGVGEVENVATGERHAIEPGTMYALNNHDKHILRATKGDLRLICAFSPALSGRETHDADGSYRTLDS